MDENKNRGKAMFTKRSGRGGNAVEQTGVIQRETGEVKVGAGKKA